ncbi:MAG: hypothetical protein QW111_03785 [Ignisphaera sp.]
MRTLFLISIDTVTIVVGEVTVVTVVVYCCECGSNCFYRYDYFVMVFCWSRCY